MSVTKPSNILCSAVIALVCLSGCSSQDQGLALDQTGRSELAVLAQRSPPREPGLGGENACGADVRPSRRCGDKLAPGDERTCTLGGRSYIVHAGRTMDPCAPVALVIDVPSTVATPQQQAGTQSFCIGEVCWSGLGSGWIAESDTPGGGFIVVTPERGARRNDEPDYLRSLVSEIKRVADIDEDRVYISGLYDGAKVAMATACKHSDVFAGVSPNAGGDPEDCPSARRPLSATSFISSVEQEDYQASIRASESMARINHCKNGPRQWRTFNSRTRDAVCKPALLDPRAAITACSEVTRTEIKPTTCRVWDDCDEGTKVVFCDVPAANPHGQRMETLDARVLYENAGLLNTPSVAWRLFQETSTQVNATDR